MVVRYSDINYVKRKIFRNEARRHERDSGLRSGKTNLYVRG
jgi:hypothetical protein